MRFPFVTEPAVFLERPNRYLVIAQLQHSGETVRVHCPDPGRLRELLIPHAGVIVHVSSADPLTTPARKTAYDLRFVEHPEDGTLISLDSRLPNALFGEGLKAGFFAPFRNYQTFAREVSVPHAEPGAVRSRIDYRLIDAAGRTCWIEVKSATLVEDGVAYFPDAVTERGRRHVEELQNLAEQGDRAAICFVVQRPDARCLRPQWEHDPAFSAALHCAGQAGVELYAVTVSVTLVAAELAQMIPVLTGRIREKENANC